MRKLLLGLSLSAICINSAQAIEFGQPLTATLHTTTLPTLAASPGKQVTVMNLQLNANQKKRFITNHNHSLQANTIFNTYPSKIEVNMNGVPVLDQGQHGTCVTFANTVAINSLLGKGDYISQLCQLELGSYLEKRGYLPSGWNGSLGPLILEQMFEFGIVNKQNQQNKACAGVSDYPVHSPYDTGNPLSLDDYKTVSEDISTKLTWEPILDLNTRLEWENEEVEADHLLNKVKAILADKPESNSKRLTFAVILPINHCGVGACAKNQQVNDTWALTREIISDQDPTIGAHEMLIVGYDDNAVAIDKNGVKHKGLLTLRNSWGTDAGDHGNYYMSYDFFKQFVFEVNKIMLA